MASARAPFHVSEEDYFLDIGCGDGKLGFVLKRFGNRRASIIGVDIWRKSLERAKETKNYENLLLCDIRFLPFKPQVFIYTACLEVIEHLTKKDGYKLVDDLEILTDGVLVISTPRKFSKMDKSKPRAMNPYQEHHSLWSPSEFKKLGFKVRGVRGRPWMKKTSLIIPQFLTWYLLFLADIIIAIKECTHKAHAI